MTFFFFFKEENRGSREFLLFQRPSKRRDTSYLEQNMPGVDYNLHHQDCHWFSALLTGRQATCQEPKEIGNIYFRDNLKSALRNSKGISNSSLKQEGKRQYCTQPLIYPECLPCVSRVSLYLGEWKGTTWWHSIDREKNLNTQKFNVLYGPGDKWQFSFRDCSSAKLFGP